MDVALWITQWILAGAFLLAGSMKLGLSHSDLAERMDFVEDFSSNAIKTIGALEVLGAIGLILPGLTGIAPILVPMAAVGIAVDQLGAIIVHTRRSEREPLPMNAVLVAASLFIAWGRFGDYPL